MRLLALALLGTALIVGGCGGGADSSDTLTPEQYGTELEGVLGGVGPRLQAVGAEIGQTQDVQQVSDGLQETEDVLRGASDDLDALEPPEEVADAHAQLIDAIDGFGDSAAQFREAAADGNADPSDTAAFRDAGQQFQTELTDVVAQLQDAGIQLGSGN